MFKQSPKFPSILTKLGGSGNYDSMEGDDDADYDLHHDNSANDGTPMTKEIVDEIDFIPKVDPLKGSMADDLTNIRRELSFHGSTDVFEVRQKHSGEI